MSITYIFYNFFKVLSEKISQEAAARAALSLSLSLSLSFSLRSGQFRRQKQQIVKKVANAQV
jgi:hypothetical protein